MSDSVSSRSSAAPDSANALDTVWRATLPAALRPQLTRCDPLHPTPDVAVIGGGLIGLACAYFLADQGLSVQVLDARSLGSGASGANFGGVWPNALGSAHPAGFQPLAFLGRDLWARLSVRPGFDFDWRVNGFLQVHPPAFAPSALEYTRRIQEEGYSAAVVDGEQIQMLEPALDPGLAAGIHYPSDAHVHPLKAVACLARAAVARKASITTGVRVVTLASGPGRVTHIETTAGTISPGAVIVATGWQTDWLGAAWPGELPVRPVSGQIVATAPLPPLLRGPVNGRYLVLQLRSGEVLTGGNLREGPVLDPDPAVTADFAQAAGELVPALRDVPFHQAWCGIRPGTPDGMPVIDRSETASNLFIACGHFRNGVLLAPACGKLLAEWVRSNKPAEELQPCRLSRFCI